jgi:aspartyl-tRNA(Asn)/glutamyl-tRNA(Gln) amidotransferase subunit A
MAKVPDDVFFATIGELNERLRAKEFSAQELARAFLDRLEKFGPRYNALALSLREAALRKARDVDREMQRERYRGPLQGIPFGVKDLLSVAGNPTTWGAKPYAGQVFPYDATVVRKLSGVGAVLTGKLAMVELAGGGGYRLAGASLTGPGLNPWDRSRWSGGSSSGSGAAVAAGLVTFAIGSETSGSILTPAAFCGVTGLRPTYGLVSRRGAMALSWTMDKIGPMCRSAEDCGLVMQVIAGKDSEDPTSAGRSYYYAPQYARPFADLTLGFAPSDWPDGPAGTVLRQALDAVRGLGFKVKETAMPDLPYGAVTGTIISAEGSAVFEELITSGKVDELADPRQIAGLRAGLDIKAKDYLRAMRVRAQIQEAFRNILADIDVLIAPSRATVASPVAEPLDAPRPGAAPAPGSPQRGLQGLIPAGNLAGLPALSLPCGFDGGLPLAIQLVGRPFSENTLLAIGKQYQTVTDWHRRTPAVG